MPPFDFSQSPMQGPLDPCKLFGRFASPLPDDTSPMPQYATIQFNLYYTCVSTHDLHLTMVPS